MNNHLFIDHEYGISTIDTGFVRPGLAASHLLVANNHAAFIDVGVNASVPRLLDVLRMKQIPVENVDYVIVTHVHLDHAGGAGQLMQALPQADLIVHPRGARHIIDPSKLIEGATAVYGEATFKAQYGEIVPIPANRVIEAKDNRVISFQQRPLVFIDTPGHAKHHFGIIDQHSSSCFTGDAFGICYPELTGAKGTFIFATTTPVQFDPVAMHESINRLLSYHPKQMYLTHYGKLTEVEAMAKKLHDSIDRQVALMKAVAEVKEQRHQLLCQRLMNEFLQELSLLECALPIEKCREWLAMDVELNAQGLASWWDKK
jgi:glyoxylase-like metal-dependent hydrolase (beta-lactamase superfamily II)